jgi:hypothetical protein
MTAAATHDTRGSLRQLVLTVAAVAVVVIAIRVAFPERTDYAGHFLAGAGGTLLLLALVLVRRGARPYAVAAACVVAILLGVGTEATVFMLAIFDPVDLGLQSLGAVLATAGLLEAEGSLALAAATAVCAGLLLIVGFWLAFA